MLLSIVFFLLGHVLGHYLAVLGHEDRECAQIRRRQRKASWRD